MSRGTRVLLHLANLLVGGTGAVYAVMRYLMEPAEPWDVVNHPWQPHVQHVHVLVAPLLVLVAGMLLEVHVRPRWRQTDGTTCRSGRGLVLMLAPMVASGYLLQVTAAPAWRQVWVVLHLGTGAAWLLAFALHWAAGRDRAVRAQRLRAAGAGDGVPPGCPPAGRAAPAGRDAPARAGDRRRAAES